MKHLLKQIDKLSTAELQYLAKYTNNAYCQKMVEDRANIENIFDMPFPSVFNSFAEKHGSPTFGFIFEDYLIHTNNWKKLPNQTVDNPGDAINHKGIRIEIKYASIQKSKEIMWNHVTKDTMATDFLLYAHDWRNSGDIYSFHLDKESALEFRGYSKNSQISLSFHGRGKWESLMDYSLGVSDSPIVPRHLRSPAKFAKAA